jgi:5-methylcytosine-specific restriction enzyme B
MDDAQRAPQWQRCLDAIEALGGRATADEVWERLKIARPDIGKNTVFADLQMLSVNAPSRTSHASGREARRTDSGNRYDRLYKEGSGSDARYVFYDPKMHGVWEVLKDGTASSTHGTSIRESAAYFSAQAAMDYLNGRYPNTYSGTTHLAAYHTSRGRSLAFDPGRTPASKKSLQIFLDAQPPTALPEQVTDYPPTKARNHHLATHAPSLAIGESAFSVRVDSLADLIELCDWYDGSREPSASPVRTAPTTTAMTTQPPLNQILYGPPGTGKTFRTVDKALTILDPGFLRDHFGERGALKERFDQLTAEQRIRFVTFHQSFSYEDFVEGLRATTEGGNLQYKVEPGIFKSICDDARGSAQVASDVGVREGARIWKISIDGTVKASPTREYCFSHGEARIGWSDVGDLRNERLAEVPAYVELGPNDRSSLRQFSREIEPGDVLLCIGSETDVQAIGVVQGEYEHQVDLPPEVRAGFVNVIPTRWLATNLSLDIRPINASRKFVAKTVYELDRFGWPELAEFLQSASIQIDGKAPAPQARSQSHVLIIDEINRGNISRIFGELITLIEPSKRKGEAEALDTVLPYSKKKFNVPNNVYLIGTMNTSDRSLAGLDIALRRRFVFEEMAAQPTLLRGRLIQGIDLEQMLRAMNSRIDVLLGRDYQIGHAYLLGVASLPDLESVFRRQILPLLQEYFFEDWENIALVLNDTNKPAEYRFLVQLDTDLEKLFGHAQLRKPNALWEWQPEAFANPASYVQIYKLD